MTRHFLVIGGQRCGTTYLAGLLESDRRIAMARPARPEPKAFLGDAVLADGLDGYRRSFFAHAVDEPVLGEKSTSYIEHPAAISRVRAVLGEPAILVQLRDPVARAVSNYRFTRSFGLEDRSLVRALSENLDGPRAWDPDLTSVSPYAYLERGRYLDHLAPWLDSFPTTHHVCFLEHLTDPERHAAALAGVYDALGLDPGAAPRPAGAAVNASEGERPELPGRLVAELRAYYSDSDAALARRLGCALPWATLAGLDPESPSAVRP